MNYQILQGDCRAALATLPPALAHCVVTSPPYFGLRDYGHDGQIGLEQTPAEYVAALVDVFAAVWRVLRDDGTLWLNLGDSYAANRSRQVPDNKWGDVGNGMSFRVPDGLKPKDMIGIPWRVVFALQDAGWYLRSDIIWHKPNSMPESVQDRPTRSHEYLFLLAKRERYYYDAQAIAEPAQFWQGQAATFERTGPVSQHVLPGQIAAQHRPDRAGGKGGKNSFRGQGAEREGATGPANREGRELADVGYGPTRNRRDVWTVATRPYPGAHFATYPPELVEPCILAGTSARGCCPQCGAPWVRVTDRLTESTYSRIKRETGHDWSEMQAQATMQGTALKAGVVATGGTRLPNGTQPHLDTAEVVTVGWQPSCTCPAADPIPCVVLDPFCGSGTTLAVALATGRNGIGVELNPAYIELAHERITSTQPALVPVGAQ